MEEEDQEKGPAKNIGELTLVCLELAAKIDEATSEEEKTSLIQEHITTYTDNTIPMVEFESGLEWFNVGRPLTLNEDLKGRISVLDFFTYCCVNCMHILPDLEALEQQYPPDNGEVLVVGVHSAKFENERVSSNIQLAIDKYHIHHPVVNDAQAKMWMQLGIACWPTLLILGPGGQPLFILVGEGHRERLFQYIAETVQRFSKLEALKRIPIPMSPSSHIEATNSLLLYPGKVAVYPNGIIISDSGHNRILLVDKQGIVDKIIGCGSRGFSDGSISSATFSNPQGTVYHHPDVIYVADTDNHAVRKIDLALDEVTTLVGTGKQGFDFEGGQQATCQVISSPWDLCMTRSLNKNEEEEENLLLIAMAGTHQIWGVFLTDGNWFKGSSYSKGTAVRLAGSGAEENRNTSYPFRAGFAQPSGISVGTHLGQPTMYIADSESSSIRKFSFVDGAVKAVVGAARDPLDLFAYGDVDGSGVDAKLQHPLGVATYKESLYVADSYNHKIKLVQASGKSFSCTTIAGSGKSTDVENGNNEVQFNEPGGICTSEEDKKLYIADTNNHSIKVLALNDNSVTELPIKMCDESDSSSQDVLNTEEDLKETVVEVGNSSDTNVHLKLIINLPSGMSLNKEAPNSWKITTQDAPITTTSTEGGLQESTDVSLNVSFSSSETQEASLRISCVMYVCLDSGVCVKRNSGHSVRFIANSNEDARNDISVDLELSVKDSPIL